jgi:phage shock protein A
MLSQQKLLKVIDDDLKVCREAAERMNPSDTRAKEQNILEFNTLMNHLTWVQRAGSDQAELERVVRSLESNELMRGYQRWRERSETA